MPENKICLSCRHYRPSNYFHGQFDRGFCYASQLRTQRLKLPIAINDARDICDKESDGHFTLFEPRVMEVAPDLPRKCSKVLDDCLDPQRREVAHFGPGVDSTFIPRGAA